MLKWILSSVQPVFEQLHVMSLSNSVFLRLDNDVAISVQNQKMFLVDDHATK